MSIATLARAFPQFSPFAGEAGIQAITMELPLSHWGGVRMLMAHMIDIITVILHPNHQPEALRQPMCNQPYPCPQRGWGCFDLSKWHAASNLPPGYWPERYGIPELTTGDLLTVYNFSFMGCWFAGFQCATNHKEGRN